MKNYLRWSLRQLYLIFFWPTQFRREVESGEPGQPKLRLGERFRYFLKMLPWIVALAAFGAIITGYICQTFGVTFKWEQVALGVALGIALSTPFTAPAALLFDGVSSVASDVVFGVAFGVAFGAAFGVAGGVVELVMISAAFGAASGVLFGGASGVSGGPRGVLAGAASTLAVGALFGLSSGATVGVADGVVVGLAGGTAVWLVYFRLLTYPFDVAISSITYFSSRWRPHTAARAWAWYPVSWNEVIWLPLPFASKLLALLVKQDREEGFRQIAFVAAERRLQRHVARDALLEVAINDLKAKSLSELSFVTEKLGWTTDAPDGELPAELMTALPRFDRAAQHVGQYLVLHSAYRKGEALENALKELEALQRSLIAARGGVAPRLLQVANGWRGMIDAERERVKELAEGVREIPNPFVFGNPVRETEQNVFTGRGDIVRQIEASVLGAGQTPTLLLHGSRRMGKSSILNQLPRLLGPDFAPAVMDCQNPAVGESREALLRYLTRAMSAGLRKRRVSVEPPQAVALAREPFAVFDEWLDKVERAMPEGMRALLCLDEYERLQATLVAGWGGALLDALRHTLQYRPRVVLMFTGAHTFQELGPEWTDRFISARRVRVSFLKREEVQPLLTKPIPEFDMTYAPGALDAVVAATNCQPFLTQAVAFELVQLLNERQRKVATPEDVEQAIARALKSGGEYFANVWSDAGADGQAILRAVVTGETPPEAPTARAWLREHDVLNEEGAFAVEMLRRWVREKA